MIIQSIKLEQMSKLRIHTFLFSGLNEYRTAQSTSLHINNNFIIIIYNLINAIVRHCLILMEHFQVVWLLLNMQRIHS